MFVINCGMPKSGTTLLMQYQKDLISSTFNHNGIEVFNNHSYSGYVSSIDEEMAAMLCKICDKYGPFLVKTHSKPTPTIRALIDRGIAKATFSFRDPRDCVLSVLDHAERTRKGLDPSGAFGNIANLSEAIAFAIGSIQLYKRMAVFGNVLFVRYEDFLGDKLKYIKSVAEYLNITISDDLVRDIYEKHERKKKTAWNFNKGIVERWRTEMSIDDIFQCEKAFGENIEAMGYYYVENN